MNVLTNGVNESPFSKYDNINTGRCKNSYDLGSCTITSRLASVISSFLAGLECLYQKIKQSDSKFIEFKTCPINHFASVNPTRVALDIGSTGMKVILASVDPIKKEITRIHYSGEYPVQFKRDMQVSGVFRFSEKIKEVAIRTLAKLKVDLARFKPIEWKGIATGASRQSENAKEVYDKIRKELGVDIAIIPQAEERRIGFLTALAVTKLNEDEIVAFDSGAGSFKLTTKRNGKLEVVEGQTGYAAAFSALITGIRKQRIEAKSKAHPVSLAEAHQLVSLLKHQMPKISDEFASKLKQKSTTVVGIGNFNSIFGMAAIAIGKNTYSKEELWKAIETHCGLTDEQLTKFTKPHEAMLAMILLYTVMEALNIDKLTYAFANGSCEGLLVDSVHWKVFQKELVK